MNGIVTVSRGEERIYMKTFTIDNDNNITVFATKKEAAAASTTPFDCCANQSELAELAAEWPVHRLVEIWNGIPGVIAVTKFTSRKIATERIWKAIQNLGERPTAAPVPEAISESTTEQPAPEPTREAATLAGVGEPAPDVAPAGAKSSQKTTRTKKGPKVSQNPEAPQADAAKTEGPREGSKTAQVVAMMKRPNGATISEIMQQMGWLKHTVRGFVAGAMKKAGYTVESFKPEGGERTYRINS
jgi:hypothetical protein